jgi:hypothetical protein
MKKASIITFLAAAILVAGIITAGCTQTASSDSSPATNSQQYSSPGRDTSPPGGNAGYRNSSFGGSRQFSGQNFLTNQTLLNAAADKLGVSEQDLQNALSATTNTTNGRPDFTATAQQLGVSQQQLLDALGFSAGGFRGRGNTTAPPAPVQ